MTFMAFLKRHKAEHDGVCDNCGKDLDEADDPIPDDGNGHEFCGPDCRDTYAEEHEHEEEEANVCEFC